MRVVHRRWYELNAHHFSHAVRPCKPPCLLHGKSYRPAQENAAQSRTEALCVGGNSSLSSVAPEHQRNENSVPFPACASEKSRSLFFSCCLSGQMHEIRLRSAEQGAEFRSYPLRECRVSLLPFFRTTSFQGVRQSYALIAAFVLGAGQQDNLTGRVENWATN